MKIIGCTRPYLRIVKSYLRKIREYGIYANRLGNINTCTQFKYLESTHLLFVDFKQNYDTIARMALYITLEQLGDKGKPLKMITLILKETKKSSKSKG